jgi:hypothetical protein
MNDEAQFRPWTLDFGPNRREDAKMKLRSRWTLLVLVIIASLQLSACGPGPEAQAGEAKEEPFHKEGDNLMLTERAAQRLDIQTTTLREEQVIRKRTTWGEVVTLEGGVGVRVRLHKDDLDKIAKDQPAALLLAGGAPALVNPAESPPNVNPTEATANAELYYVVDGANQGLVPGQRVRVELALSGTDVQRKLIPYSAILYDVHGDTWVYTSPKPLTFIRQRIVVDYIEGDLAMLTEGPPANTTIVTVGASELFGAESGVGH